MVKKEEAAQRLEREMLAKEEGQAVLAAEARAEASGKSGRHGGREKKVAVAVETSPEESSAHTLTQSAEPESSEKNKNAEGQTPAPDSGGEI